jgi:predicted nucleotidyltransferase component of viral defense system
MSKPEATLIWPHEDAALFRAALTYTAAQTAFPSRLIEKDYRCTLLLAELSGTAPETMVFKGGTCLAKVHAEFYRLSEDLDFAIPVAVTATRSLRRRLATELKAGIAAAVKRLSSFDWAEPLVGRNNSAQYIGTLRYASAISNQTETIQIEVSLREPLMTAPIAGAAKTILMNPISGNPSVSPVFVRCISKIEAMAEKFRAALTRRDVAIRDFYDIHYAVKNLGLHPYDPELIALVRQKLAVPGNDGMRVDQNRMSALRVQIDAQLRPVLRQQNFDAFNLADAIKIVRGMASSLK